MATSKSSQRQLEDVNDKLGDLSLPAVTAADVKGTLQLNNQSHPVVKILAQIVQELGYRGNNPIAGIKELLPIVAHVHGKSQSAIKILDFACSELQTQRLAAHKAFVAQHKPQKSSPKTTNTTTTAASAKSKSTTATASASPPQTPTPTHGTTSISAELTSTLRKLASCLAITNDANIESSNTADVVQLLHRANEMAKKSVASNQTKGTQRRLLNKAAVDSRREVLERINNALRADYRLRRRMLLQRADITLQSFLWTDHVDKAKLEKVSDATRK